MPKSESIIKHSDIKSKSYRKPLLALLQWYRENRQDYFFRKNRNPYITWVSEVALQQTRIQAALEPLQRFLERFPNLESLAAAREGEVLEAFRGLGYYNRARNLHKGAKYILHNYAGRLPEKYQELLEIPSIGPYTAAAIASICFQEPVPALDGNIKRVLSRVLALSGDTQSRDFISQISSFLCQAFLWISPHSPGDLNEALMELGQQICRIKQARCQLCTLQQVCLANQQNKVKYFPQKKEKQKREEVIWYMLILSRKRGRELFLHSWKDFSFLKGHLGFPSLLYFPAKDSWEKSCVTESGTGAAFLKESGSIDKLNQLLQPAASLEHHIMHYRIEVRLCPLSERDLRRLPLSCRLPDQRGKFYPREQLESMFVPSLLLKSWRKAKSILPL